MGANVYATKAAGSTGSFRGRDGQRFAARALCSSLHLVHLHPQASRGGLAETISAHLDALQVAGPDSSRSLASFSLGTF